MQLSTLIDNVVCDQDGNAIGAIDELLLCCRSGRISHAVVLCLDRTRLRVPWRCIAVSKAGFVLRNSPHQ